MNGRERLRCLLAGDLPDRIGVVDAPWPETRARWYREGLPAGVHANDHFETDLRHLIRVDDSLRLPESVVEETADHLLVRTANGSLTRCWRHSGVPHTLEYGLRDRDDWRRLRDRLAPDPARFGWGYYGDYGFECLFGDLAAVRAAADACPTRDTTFVPLGLSEPYEAFLGKMGDERLLTLMVEDPGLAGELFDAHVAFANGMLDLAVASGLRPDALWIGGDIAYRNGLLFSPALYRELLLPRHRAMVEHAKRVHGLPVIYHTDGNCLEAIPLLIEAGIDCLQPLEARAGLDVRELVRHFGDALLWMGNINADLLARGGDALREEVAGKVSAMARGRFRYVFHSDHSVPPQVSFASFSEAVALAREHGRYPGR